MAILARMAQPRPGVYAIHTTARLRTVEMGTGTTPMVRRPPLDWLDRTILVLSHLVLFVWAILGALLAGLLG